MLLILWDWRPLCNWDYDWAAGTRVSLVIGGGSVIVMLRTSICLYCVFICLLHHCVRVAMLIELSGSF